MQPKELITHLIKQSPNWTQNKLGREIGLTSQAMYSRMKSSTGFRVDFLVESLNALGYDLVAVPKGSRLPNGSIRVERSEDK